MISAAGHPFKNVGTQAIPAFGVAEVVNVDKVVSTQNGSRVELQVRQIGSQYAPGSYASSGPAYLFQRGLVFNGPAKVNAEKHGQCQPLGAFYFAAVKTPGWDLTSTSDTRNKLAICYAMRNKALLECLDLTATATHVNCLLDPVQGIADYLVSEWRILKVVRDLPNISAKLCIVQAIENRVHLAQSQAVIDRQKYGSARFYLTERTAWTLSTLDGIQEAQASHLLPVLNWIPDDDIDANKRLHVQLVDGCYHIVNAEC